MTSLPLASLPLAPLLLITLLWPLLLGLRPLLVDVGRWKLQQLDWPWLTAAWPALALVVFGADGGLRLDAWLTGGRWELDGQRRLLLALTALLWALAAWYARGYLRAEQQQARAGDATSRARLLRFGAFWPLTLCGNLLLLVAEDIASFYLGFALMTFAAYPLVIHNGSRVARRGGFAYLIMALVGEALILAGLLWGAGSGHGNSLAITLTELRLTLARAESGVWIGLLLWLGFGVKAGVIGLHTWLPLAHPVAPTPASAVLSGAMIKAGLVGWLSTLPLGLTTADPAFRGLGLAMLGAGLAGAFAAALVGVVQRQPKTVLAYSSVSQMGLLAVLVSLGLLQPQHWPMLSAAVILFTAHHGLNKGALFLGVEISRRPPPWPSWLLWTLMALPALSLAGALGSGLVAKWAYKSALDSAGDKRLLFWSGLAAVGTTALMARTLWLQWQERQEPRRNPPAAMPLAWLICVLAGLSLPLWIGWHAVAPDLPPLTALPALLWPLALGLLLSLVLGWSLCRFAPQIALQLSRWLPAGDLWWPLAWCARGLLRAGRWTAQALANMQAAWVTFWVAREQAMLAALDQLIRAEGWLRRQLAMLLLALAGGLAALLLSYP
ncbi:Hydrogenase-4 component B [Thiorhodovibrio winogradskyi]|uniref:Hydrogenase-4 component B n=1 Tax=Thiorhodovibrio winogradskyi TaxID=77007 RepID=A0ABZ0S330_9GAMM|nr:complex I subunit 5 family protein [Thiorhodovibrio winogradskyi]